MKRFLPMLAVLVLLTGVLVAWLALAGPALAQESDFPRQGTVLREASLRTGPGLRFEIISKAEAGLVLTIIDANATGEWYLLEDDLWISASLVELEGEEGEDATPGATGAVSRTPTRTPARTPTATRTPRPTRAIAATVTPAGGTILLPNVTSSGAAAATVTGVVLQHANLRAGPGVSYAIEGKAPIGTVLTIVGANAAGDWLQTEAGQWIAAFLVRLNAPISAGTIPTTTIAAPSLLIRPLLTFTEPLPVGAVAAKVVAVTEGDSIRIEIGGATEEVRYAGIDAPDASVTGFQTALAANQALVGGATVYLAPTTVDRDNANRLLRYVYTADGHLINAELLAQGWALPQENPPAFDRAAEFNRLAANAALAGRGFWSGASPLGNDVAPYAITARAGAIYADPGANNPTVADVAANIPVALLGRTEDGAWVQVRVSDGATGWTYMPQLRPNTPISQLPVTYVGTPGPTPAPGAAVAPTPMPVVGTATVVNAAELRAGPGMQFAAAGTAQPGSTVAIVGRSADSQWFMLDSGLWIPANALVNAPLNAPVTEPIATPTPALPIVGQATVLSQAELRSGPGMQFPVLSVAPAGSTVNIVGRSVDGVWYLTDTGGWLPSFALLNPPTNAPVVDPAAAATPTPPGGAAPPGATLPVFATANVIVQTDLRTGPGPQFPSVSTVFPGTPVSIVGRSADSQWFFTTQNVWVIGAALDNQPFNAPVTDGGAGGATPTVAPTPLTVIGTASVIVQTNLNAGPGPQYAVISTAFPGTLLDISGRTGDGQWYLTSTGAWVATTALTNVPPNAPITDPTPTPLPNGLVVVGNGQVFVGTELRSAPGPQYEQVGYADAGSTIPIVGRSTDGAWYLTANGAWILAAAVTNAPVEMPSFEPTATPFGTPPPTPTTFLVGVTATPTPTFPPPPPSITPTPTNTPPAAAVIRQVDRLNEWVIIANEGGSGLDLTNWALVSENGGERCALSGVIPAGGSLRIWSQNGPGGQYDFSCQLPGEMWNNDGADAVLLQDPTGFTVARKD